MTDQMCGPSATAPQTTNKVAHCQVCGIQWQILSFAEPPTDAQGCGFCGSDERAITLTSEEPGYEGYAI